MNPILVLNIGTARSRDLVLADRWRGDVRPDTPVTGGQAKHIQSVCGLRVLAHEFRRNDGPENTHIFIVTGSGDVTDKIGAVSAALHQDCIAVYNVRTTEGCLVGPNAEAWGEFNPTYFHQPSDNVRRHAMLLAALYHLRETPPGELWIQDGICGHVCDMFRDIPGAPGGVLDLLRRVFLEFGLCSSYPVVIDGRPDHWEDGHREWNRYEKHRWDRDHPYGQARWKLVDDVIQYLETNNPEVES